jgi:heterodisulfide reductase subunit A-like polyferredoxin
MNDGPAGQFAGYTRELAERAQGHALIDVYPETRLAETTGFVGNFTSRLKSGDGRETTVRHGVVIVATGAQEWRGDAYDLGKDPRVLTMREFAARLDPHRAAELPDSVVFIQCAGPADKYCGRLCCSESLENALQLKQLNPSAQVVVLYKDIRTYGFRERLYQEARQAGVMFVRYDDAHTPQLDRSGQALSVRAWDPMLREELVLHPDLIVLAAPLVPHADARELANILKVPIDQDGWFLEAHVKLRPVDFPTEGVFVAGTAHYPKFPNEAIAQAQAAAARAATILAKDYLHAGGIVASVDPAKCTGCLTCVRICPYRVPRIDPTLQAVGGVYGAAHIEAAACQGCGICAAECPAKAIELQHFKDGQVVAKIEALFATSQAVPA